MLQVTNLEKSYGKQLLFDGVSFTVNPRERVGLVGRNGHGKSTLFRMILNEEHAGLGHDHDALGLHRRPPLAAHPLYRGHGAQGGLPRPAGERGPHRRNVQGRGHPARPRFHATRISKSRLTSLSGGYQVRLNLAKVLAVRAEPAAARRAHELPRHRLGPLAHAVPARLADRDDHHHPRPRLHGQRHDAHHDHPPLQDAQGRGRHAEALRPDPDGRGDLREDPPERREEAQGGRAVHQPVPGPGHQGKRGAVAHQGARPAREAGQARGDQAARLQVPVGPLRGQVAHDRGGPVLRVHRTART